MEKYDDEVKALEQKITRQIQQGIVFYGSSSIRLWVNLANDFPQAQPLNLGFGGSTLAACAWYADRLVVPANPRFIVFYAGDNDLGDESRQPEEVYLFFCALAEKIKQHLPGTQLAYISIKPSPARWHIIKQIRRTNELIANEIRQIPNFQYVDINQAMLDSNGKPRRELYENDGLHLNPAGYTVWREELLRQLPILNSR